MFLSCESSNIFKSFGVSSTDEPTDEISNISKDFPYYFDYREIEVQPASSIDVLIESCNLYVDIYGNLVVLGEVVNTSPVCKTNIVVTFDFLDKEENKIISANFQAPVNFLREKARLPFWLYFDDREKYIDISKLRIGINYKNYLDKLNGNPVVKTEKYYYRDDTLVIEGKLVNLGESKVDNIMLFCTFYNEKDQVVFIRQCYLPKEELETLEEEDFILEVLMDEYLKDFTDYHLEVFFEDSIELPKPTETT